jgi:hypothetical protein
VLKTLTAVNVLPFTIPSSIINSIILYDHAVFYNKLCTQLPHVHISKNLKSFPFFNLLINGGIILAYSSENNYLKESAKNYNSHLDLSSLEGFLILILTFSHPQGLSRSASSGILSRSP